jgi:hypothetical protein
MSIRKSILATTLVATTMLSSPVLALVEDDSTYISTFNTLTDGMASVSLVWTLHADSYEQSIALQALLSAKVNSPTDDVSTRQSIDFRTINNVDYAIGASPTQLIFTMQAPQDNFAAACNHVAALFSQSGIDANWLKRQSHAFRPISATRLRTPEILEAELVRYVNFPSNAPVLTGGALQNEVLRSPNRIIMNAKDYDFENTADILMGSFDPYDATLNNTPPIKPRSLPTGTIHLADADSTETLIFMGQTREFGTLTQQAQTDTLFKYMGYGPGSEMFRIVRQEKRASYDPRSHFTQIGEQRAFTGLSATVPSEKWPEIHDVIAQIYTDTRAGNNNEQGLNNSRNSMLNSLIGDLRREPNWLVQRYLELHPTKPPQGQISLDLLDASFDMDIDDINAQADNILPSADNMLTVIIGGEIAPSADMQKNGFCSLPVGEPLAYCLDKLATQ